MEKEDSLRAAAIAQADFINTLKKYRVTPGRIAKRLGEALDAKYESGDPDYKIRLRAVEIGAKMLDVMPSEKLDVTGNITVEIVRFGKDKTPE